MTKIGSGRFGGFTSFLLLLLISTSRSSAQTSFNYSTTIIGNGDVGTPVSMRVWLPPSVTTIKGLIFDYPGTSGDTRNITTNGTWQARLPGMGFGIVGFKDAFNTEGDYWGADAAAVSQNLQGELNTIAGLTGHPEIANAPVFLWGFSTGSQAVSEIAQSVPTRTIGFLADKGGDYGTFPADSSFKTGSLSSAAKVVPGLFDGGSIDPDYTNSQENSYLNNWRTQQGADVGLAVEFNTAHAQTNPDFRFAFVGETIKARYPQGALPSSVPGNPLVLNTVPSSATSGWLSPAPPYTGSSFAPNPWAQIGPASSFSPAVAANAVWLPTDTMAMVYRAQEGAAGGIATAPLQMSLINGINGDVDGGKAIELGVSLTGITPSEIDIYHEDQLFAELGPSASVQDVFYTPSDNGIQTFVAVATYTLNGQTAETSNYITVGVAGVPVPEPSMAGVVLVGSAMALLGRRRCVG